MVWLPILLFNPWKKIFLEKLFPFLTKPIFFYTSKGNKADSGPERIVRKEDGERLAREYNVAFMETSAKTGLNVELAFTAIARELKSRKSENPDETAFNVRDYVREQSQRSTCPPCSTWLIYFAVT